MFGLLCAVSRAHTVVAVRWRLSGDTGHFDLNFEVLASVRGFVTAAAQPASETAGEQHREAVLAHHRSALKPENAIARSRKHKRPARFVTP
jgi:hypothetical protein